MEYTENYIKSIDEAMADEAFVAKLAKAQSKEELQNLFQQEKGIALEAEPAQAAYDKIESVRNGGELSAEDLENVAGGWFSSGRASINLCSFGNSFTDSFSNFVKVRVSYSIFGRRS